MYSGVPNTAPLGANRGSIARWARPKSRIFTKSFPTAARREQNVVALQIAMNDAEVVGARERCAHLLEDVERSAPTASAPRARLARERRTHEVLHDEVELALLGFADVMNIDDMCVVDAVGGARFTQHPRPQVRLASQVWPDQL